MRDTTRTKSVGLRRVLRIAALASAACAALQLGPAASASAGTLDQQQTDTSFNMSNGLALVGNPPGAFNQSGGQVFTPGITGALDQVDLSFNKQNNPPDPLITVQIRSTSAGIPGGNSAVLATASLDTASVGAAQAFVPVPIAPPVPVTAGTQYAIVAYNAGGPAGSFGWGQSTGDAYSGGAGYNGPESLPPNTTWNPLGNSDLAFKTYVVPSSPTAPLPATPATPASTGLRAAALKKCKKKKSKKARKKCKKRAQKLPI